MNKSSKNIIPSDVLLDSMPGIAYVFKLDGSMVAWGSNEIKERMGYTDEEIENKYILDFIHEDERELVSEAIQNTIRTGKAQFEHLSLKKTGEKSPVLVTTKLVVIEEEEYIVGLSIDITELYDARKKIDEQISEIKKLNELLSEENLYLKDEINQNIIHSEIIGDSEALKYIFFKIKQVANTDAAVLIEGETGTGKELIARAIHRESERKDKPFIKVNCASIPENLFESELFGHKKGAFTGAIKNHIGRFELANGGTLFLDEVSELPLNAQSKLLHVLQEGEFEKVGSSKTQNSDVRIITATNKILYDEIEKGRFREDLFYRLNVFPISVLPLRERKEDIPVLIEHFVNKYSKKFNKGIKVIPKDFINRLTNYNWPGNIRELENIVERAIITSSNQILKNECLLKPANISSKDASLEEFEKNHIIKVLSKTNWKISGDGGAASILKLNAETLRSKMRKLGIKRNTNR